MASSELISGVIGVLVGVGGAAVGAFATLSAAKGQQASEERRDAARRDSESQAEIARRHDAAREEARVSARILQSDLIEGTNRLQRALDWNRFWAPHFSISNDAWLEYRASTARHMDAAAWAGVSTYYLMVGICEGQAIGARADSSEKRPTLTGFQRWNITVALDVGKEALEALEGFSGDANQSRLADEALRRGLTPPS